MPRRGPRRAVSMADVAAAAGVSITTVSHVLNHTRPVGPDTEHAVLAAVARVGYVPDSVVRSQHLVNGSRTLGLAMSAISNIYFGGVVHGIERAAAAVGYSLLLTDTHDEVDGELRAVNELLSHHVAAIILAASEDPLASLEHARQQHIPVIAIDRFVAAEVDQVACESVEATAQLVDHLAQIGHQRIAMISGKPGLGTTKDRVRGFRLGMRRNGLRVNAGLIVPGNSQDDIAHEAMTRLLRRSAPPTAVVVGNNRMTIGAVRAARDSGVDIPGDLALVGFDDFEWADLFHPGLTVIAQPTAALCRQAVELVMSRLTDPGAPVRRVALQPTFVHRESCGCR